MRAQLLVAALVCLAPCWPANAVSPPAIDDTRLPEPAPPAPPQRTRQREVCTVPAFDPQRPAGQLDGLDLSAIWRLTRGRGQRVAVIDTGVSPHRRLAQLTPGGDYAFTGDGTQDCDGHGTLVAGIIAAAPDPSDTFAGVAPDAEVIAIRQSSTRFGWSQSGVGNVDTMAMAVRTAADLGATVINISTVACVPAGSEFDDRALGAALAYAVDVKNAVVVAAAGNSGGRCPAQATGASWDTATVVVSPAWYDDHVLTVGSVDAEGTPSAFTLAGPWVDVAAPGEAVLSLSPVGDAIVNVADGGGPIGGTSYAAPVVSGVAALIRSRFPELTARQVMARIESTAHHPPGGWNPVVGSGVVDAAAALRFDAPSPPPPVAPAAAVPPPPTPADRPPPTTALTGSALCLAVLLLASAGLRIRGGRRVAGG